MGTLHLAHYLGPVGFARPVHVKRFHAPYASDPDFVRALVRGARLAARVRQANIVSTLDVVAEDGVLMLVTDDVRGESLARVLRRRPPGRRLGQGNAPRRPGEVVSPRHACTLVSGVLHGLAAAHDLRSKRAPGGIVHGAISPDTILVGFDGLPRVTELGMSRLVDWLQTSREGRFRSSLGYTAPEVARGEPMSVRSDLFAVSAVLWETLTDRPLFAGSNAAEVLEGVLSSSQVQSPREHADVTEGVAAVVLRGLARDPEDRFSSAREMIDALDATGELAGGGELSVWADSLRT